MQDMLVRLHDLPNLDAALKRLAERGVTVRQALPQEKPDVLTWLGSRFPGWRAETEIAFHRLPVSCHLAIKGNALMGFACYDATAPNFFGPTGVDEAARGDGIGYGLLLSVLHAQKAQGYAYAIIGGVGPAEFYEKTVGAIVIPGSEGGLMGGKQSFSVKKQGE